MIETVKLAVEKGLSYRNGDIIGVSGKILKPRNGGKGYRVISVPKIGGGFVNVYVHKLVYWFETGDENAFNPDYEIHHKDKNRSNNVISNLELLGAREHEGISSKLNTHGAKITLEISRELKAEYARGGISQKALGVKFGLSQQHVSEIISGKKWGDIWG